MRAPPRRRLGRSLAVALALVAGPVHAQDPVTAEEEVPKWRFKKDDRRVKVVVVAGSVGAYQRDSYAQRIGEMCSEVEVKNLSKAGLGAWALKNRFRDQALRNRYLKREAEHEYWMIWQGGLNSVGTPEKTNSQIRQAFLLAHANGYQVVGLSLTPWGDRKDSRFRGYAALRAQQNTHIVVDFVVGRLPPAQALGRWVSARDEPEAVWAPEELADVGVDLYDSALRHHMAEPLDLDRARRELNKDDAWKRSVRDLEGEERKAALERDARALARSPRWFMREELRAFDHIHPNADGHRLVAETMCPQLPESWGCACPAPPPRPVEPEQAASSAATAVGQFLPTPRLSK